jgi:hypothetical protein
LPAGYQGGQPPVTSTRRRAAVHRRPAQPLLFPWDTEEPVFDMDAELMELRGLPNGHLFNDFELAEYINERLANYEHAREEMAAEHQIFKIIQMKNKCGLCMNSISRTLIGCRYVFILKGLI